MTNRRPPETPRWLRVTLRCGAVCLLAGGLTYCTDQAELTSIDPALAPPVQETVFLDTGGERPIANPPLVVDGDSLFLAAELSREEVVLRALAARTEMLAVERELRPIQLLQVLRQPGHGGADGLDVLTPTPADLFVLTPDHGTGDWSAEAVEAALVRYQLVRESALAARREATYLECEIEGKSVSGGELTSVSGTCETVETNERKRTPRK